SASTLGLPTGSQTGAPEREGWRLGTHAHRCVCAGEAGGAHLEAVCRCRAACVAASSLPRCYRVATDPRRARSFLEESVGGGARSHRGGTVIPSELRRALG